MSDTGGGHRASTEANKATFNEQFGDKYQVLVTDLWIDHTLWPFNQLPRSYNFLVKYDPLWRMTYYASAPRVVHQSNFAATSAFIASFHKLVTRCYCPSEEVARRALNAGFQPSQIKVIGLPVRPSFVKLVCPKVELRKELEMEGHLPAVLLMGGGEGMGPIEATARALANESLGEPIGQVLVICGRNKKLADRLYSIYWKIPVQAGRRGPRGGGKWPLVHDGASRRGGRGLGASRREWGGPRGTMVPRGGGWEHQVVISNIMNIKPLVLYIILLRIWGTEVHCPVLHYHQTIYYPILG
ncbi:hypothetical protein R3W88_004760 [Solanum pinnatisectum]|uniref:Diacylglycerol glucosyltransferase N-terminal domain-containing protein n=1 Tax=Solanum pinnatisectum TaxID=50273 RepID=A0AAV9KDT8_9SOLN|nr:hypothetical protein R3W88_004760 [Solanum pinnatisectum]